MIAAVEGYAVAGGLELALWCDLRVAATDAVFGVFCRRWGVPLIDGGTVRLPRLIGQSHALDLILTGRGVSGDEALRMGLANRLVEPGGALAAAVTLAKELAALPATCLRSDRMSAYEQWDQSLPEALRTEYGHGLATLAAGDALEGAMRFAGGRAGTDNRPIDRVVDHPRDRRRPSASSRRLADAGFVLRGGISACRTRHRTPRNANGSSATS